MEITENNLIKKLKRFEQKNGRVIRGIGDDGAVVEMAHGRYVFVQDALVEHIHFEFSFTRAFSVGKKSIYVNVSDILSMGAEPLYFLVTIGIPDAISYKDIENLYKGMHRAAGEFNVTLLGGDTVETGSDFFIDVSMVGILRSDTYMGRNTANAGDFIGVTGWLGESAYGLQLLKKGHDPKRTNRFVKRYGEPKPPYSIWKELMKRGITNAMMDISDGLIIDLERMMSESKKGAVIYMENIPTPDVLKRNGKENLAISGGEDYQLLFTFHKNKLEDFQEMKKNGFHVSLIGQVNDGKGIKILKNGKVMEIGSKGYEHFGVNL
jgi:thiamine-monophosphate kinase